jgi:hypothetical protein
VNTVNLTYFKQSGKYYSEGCYVTEKKAWWEIIEEVETMLGEGRCPGLQDDAVLRNEFVTHVDIAPDGNDDSLCVPAIILPQNLKKRKKAL